MRISKRIFALCLCLLLAFTGTTNTFATIYQKTTTRYFSCRVHSNCTYIAFVSEGNTDTGDVYDKYFSGSHSHWPNAFTYDSVWSYKIGNTGFAKGTYTIYSSLITQWASLSFSSTTETFTHTY